MERISVMCEFGQETRPVTVSAPSTVGGVASALDIDTSGKVARLNGVPCDMDEPVADGDSVRLLAGTRKNG